MSCVCKWTIHGWAEPCNAEKHATIIQSCVLDARLRSILAHLTILASFNHLFNPSATPNRGQSVSQLVRSLHAMYAFDFSFTIRSVCLFSIISLFSSFYFLFSFKNLFLYSHWIAYILILLYIINIDIK